MYCLFKYTFAKPNRLNRHLVIAKLLCTHIQCSGLSRVSPGLTLTTTNHTMNCAIKTDKNYSCVGKKRGSKPWYSVFAASKTWWCLLFLSIIVAPLLRGQTTCRRHMSDDIVNGHLIAHCSAHWAIYTVTPSTVNLRHTLNWRSILQQYAWNQENEKNVKRKLSQNQIFVILLSSVFNLFVRDLLRSGVVHLCYIHIGLP